ncbi:MAG TPA: rhomboid family intramembrane serine protease [Gemmatimonadales bacterium]|nr:rhomboid family intramembrane serine protease [Gemmatimonadales bacterium]
MTAGPPDTSGNAEEPILITAEMLAPRRPRVVLPSDGRIDFERHMRKLPPLVIAVVAANVAVFAWEVAAGSFLESKELIESGVAMTNHVNPLEAGALVRANVLAGEWWRMFTAMFLHAGPEHLIGNLIAFYIVGMACEHAFGTVRTAIVYLWSGVTGAALSLAAGPGPSVGASGAIFGVLGAVIVTLYRHQRQFYVRDKRIGVVLAAWAAWQLVTGFMTPFIDNFAHLGGLFGGALAALVLSPTLTASTRLMKARGNSPMPSGIRLRP